MPALSEQCSPAARGVSVRVSLPIRRLAEQTDTIHHWSELPRGGDFPALEVPSGASRTCASSFGMCDERSRPARLGPAAATPKNAHYRALRAGVRPRVPVWRVMPGSATLGPRALNRALLARQLLLERASMSALDALTHLVGLQAQAPRPPYVGLWTRLTNFDPSELSDLIVERRAVRIALQRGTIHAVSASDALVLRPLLQPVFERWLRQVSTRLGGAPLDAVAAAAREVLEDQPLTFAQISGRLAERWPDAERAALGNVARGALALVQVPPRGLWGQTGPVAHTTIEAWLGAPLDRTGTFDDLLVRYLTAFGPASIRDAQMWCGLTGLAEVAERLRPRLCAFRDEAGRELLDLPDAPRPPIDTPAPVRFLPPWDNVLRAHADRSRVMSDEHRHALRRPNDVVPGTVLVDGFLAATWAQQITSAAASLTVVLLRPLTPREQSAISAEGRRLLRWSAPHIPASAHTMTVGS